MKTKYFILLVLLAFSAVSGWAKPIQQSALDRSTAELTASLLLEKLQADILGGKPDSDILSHEMGAHPGKYIAPDPARQELEMTFRDNLAARYADAAGKYLDRLAGEAGRADFFGDAFLKEAMMLPEARLAVTVSKTYPEAFLEARLSACHEQAKTLIASIRPSEAEFEDTPREVLSATLTTRIAEAQEKPVFQENLVYISDTLVKPMLEEAENQRKKQHSFIDSQLVDGWSPATIARALNEELIKHVEVSAKQNEAEGRIAYGVFPSVVASIVDVATKRAVNKISRVVEEMPVGVDSAAIQKAIEQDPITHRNAAASMQAFSPQLESSLTEDLLVQCKKLVPENEWESFEAFGRESLENGPIRIAVINRVRKELLPKVKAIREEYAQRQVAARFPDLMTERWYPSGALVDDVTAQVDFRKAVKAWRAMPEMALYAQSAVEPPLVEESEPMLDTAIAALFERGRMAQTRQHGIVNDVFNEIKDAVGEERELPELAVAVERYTQKVVEVWGHDRDGVLWSHPDALKPDNAAEQHVALFPSTEERILLKVKSLMESLERERKEQEAIPEVPPEEVQPEQSDSDASTTEKPELIQLDCRFELDQRGSDIQLVFFVGEERKAVLACSHAPSRYRREFAQTVERAVTALIDEMTGYTSTGSRVTLAVEIIVRNGLVYHGIVAGLADALNEKTEVLSETGVELNLVPAIMER